MGRICMFVVCFAGGGSIQFGIDESAANEAAVGLIGLIKLKQGLAMNGAKLAGVFEIKDRAGSIVAAFDKGDVIAFNRFEIKVEVLPGDEWKLGRLSGE